MVGSLVCSLQTEDPVISKQTSGDKNMSVPLIFYYFSRTLKSAKELVLLPLL